MDMERTPMGPFEAMLPMLMCVVVLLQCAPRRGPHRPMRSDGLATGCSRMTVPEGHLPLASHCVSGQGWNLDLTTRPLTPSHVVVQGCHPLWVSRCA